MKLETLAIHGANKVTDAHQPVIQPITLSSTFKHGAGEHLYTRMSNPNRSSLEELLARMEYGKAAAAFASGNTAGMSVFQALPVGSHAVLPDDMYHGLRNQLMTLFSDRVAMDFVDLTDPENLKQALRENTRLLWIETPSNPLLKVSDIQTLAETAREQGVRVVCDNTFATPVFQNPLLLGADMVMHSSTKYLGGHSDLLGGALITREEDGFWERIRQIQELGGAVPAPFDCYFLARSIKTLPYRMRGHAANAGQIAAFLDRHEKVEKVYYPGLSQHPGHEVALRQMSGFGGMLSFLVKGDAEQTGRMIGKLKYFSNATSLGGVESLIERRAAIEGPTSATPPNLVRMSVGLEHVDDLLEDLEQAMAGL